MMRGGNAGAWTARALLAGFVVALALIVLLPSEGHRTLELTARVAKWVAVHAYLPYRLVFRVVEFGANIALFVPLGVLLPLAVGLPPARLRQRGARRPDWRPPLLGLLAIATGFAVSFGIELAQRFIPGRVSDPRDVVANTLGTLVGVLILFALRRALARRRARASARRPAPTAAPR